MARQERTRDGGAGGLCMSGPDGGGSPRGGRGGPRWQRHGWPQLGPAGACPTTDWGSSSRALRVAIGVKRADSEAAAPASTRTARAAPEAAAPMSWDGHDIDGRAARRHNLTNPMSTPKLQSMIYPIDEQDHRTIPAVAAWAASQIL
jgi:hypothetical protein